MNEHPAVVFIQQAHERAEEVARAAHSYKLVAAPGSPSPDGWVVDEALCLLKAGAPTAEFIVRYGPASVLRRVAAERELLAEHADQGGNCRLCGAWTVERIDGVEVEVAFTGPLFPCRTVLLLAEAWGWAEER